MLKRFIPDYYSQNIYEVDVSFFRNIGVKYLLVDLDNTLDSYRAFVPNERAIAFKNKIEEYNIKFIIISNNKGSRVSSYAGHLNVEFCSSTRKPLKGKLTKFLQNRGIPKKEVLLVGDQILTDVLCAKNVGIKVMLTEKLVKEDQWTTRVNRLFDRPIRKYLKKKGRLKSWEEK